jgi:HEAT repeat protein
LNLFFGLGQSQETRGPDFNRLIGQLNNEDRLVRLEAAEKLKAAAGRNLEGQRQPITGSLKKAIPALVRALGDPYSGVAGTASGALTLLGDEAVPALIGALQNDPNPRVRSAAAGILEEERASAAIPALIAALKDADRGVRMASAFKFYFLGPPAKVGISALIGALKDQDSGVRLGAAASLAELGHNFGPEVKTAVPALVSVLQDPDELVRGTAFAALASIGPEAESAIPALSGKLRDQEPWVRSDAAAVLASIGPEARAAVPALISALRDPDEDVRARAAFALWAIELETREIGRGTKLAIPVLIAALKSQRAEVRNWVASSLVEIANKSRDSMRTNFIGPLTDVAKALDAANYPAEAQQARTAVDNLQAIYWGDWGGVLQDTIRAHPYRSALVAVYLVLFLAVLGLFWISPLVLLQVGSKLEALPTVPPQWLGGFEVLFSHVLLVGFFCYHTRVLDAWVSQHIGKAREQFGAIPTVQQRAFHVESPVGLDRKRNPSLKLEDLKNVFEKNRVCLLIWGEGGAGKTSLACQIARWGMEDDAASRLSPHQMLPVIIEHDLNLDGEKDPALTQFIRGQLRDLIGADEPPSQKLTVHLLKKKRLLLIVDSLSELNEATHNKIRPLSPDFAANTLIVTSRTEESLDGVPKNSLHPLRIRGDRLSSFMEAYLTRRGTRDLFDDPEFFNGCSKLSVMVGDRDCTVLLAKLYAEQMIASKERATEKASEIANERADAELPETIPDLILQYLNELNRREPELDDRSVHAAAKKTAWECLRRTFRPSPASTEAVLRALGGNPEAQKSLDHLEGKLQLIQIIGAGRDRVKFSLDPLAEYLAALHILEENRDSEQRWSEFLDHVDQAGAPAGVFTSIKGFLLAVRDCCLVKAGEAGISSVAADLLRSVAKELGRRSGLDPEAVNVIPTDSKQ